MDLEVRWNKKYPADVGNDVITRWQESQRHYHDIRHLQSVLNYLDWAWPLLEQSGELTSLSPDEKQKLFNKTELALWYHDVIYDPKAKDNEEKSAELFKKHADTLNLDARTTEEVFQLILITKTHRDAKTLAERIVVDCDLASLGAEAKVFKQNSADIRKEYAHVPKPLFEAGRKKMLHEFLQMSPIYKTAPFRETYEAAAKANLQQATSAAIVRVSKKICKWYIAVTQRIIHSHLEQEQKVNHAFFIADD